MKKILNKKNLLYLLSFVLPLIILFIVSTICGYIPFGKYSFNVFDAYFEYPAFLMEFKNMLIEGRSIFYTLHGGLGVNFFSILNLYMGSPLNLLFLLFKNENIYLFYTIIIYLKIGLSGLSMYYYLNSKNSKYKDTLWIVIFSLMYSLSGYAVAFNMHIMWMDAYILLPLVIKQLDKLILKGRGFKYTLLLSFAIIINYYTGYMLCIFMVIYFIYKSLMERQFNKRKIFIFLKYSLFAGLISSIVLIPTIFNLLGGRFSDLSFDNMLGIDTFTFFSQVYNMTVGSFVISDNYNFGSTTIYVTVFALVLVIYYFFNKNVSKRNKIITSSVLLFFYASFSFMLIDYAWNMFQAPIWWSHRYQFVYVFLLIVIAFESFNSLDGIYISKSKKLILVLVFMLITGASLCYKLLGSHLPDYYALMLIFSFIIFFVYLSYFKINYLFMALIILEIGINAYPTLIANRGKKYNYMVNEYNKNKDLVGKINNNNYRTLNFNLIENDGLLMNYNGVELFSSSYNINTANFMNNVYVTPYDLNHQKIRYYNPAILSLLGVKYLIEDSDYYECNNNICENLYAMPLVYQVNKEIKNLNINEKNIANVNLIYSTLLDDDILLVDIIDDEDIKLVNAKIKNKKVTANNEDDGEIYINYEATDDVLILFNQKIVDVGKQDFFRVNDNKWDISKDKVIFLNKKDTLEFRFPINYGIDYDIEDFYFLILDNSKYIDSIKKLIENTNYQGSYDNNYIINGNITTDAGMILITIPYDDGLTVLIDNKKVDYYKVLDAFIGIDVSGGIHNIKVSYCPKGFKLGLIISIISFICFGILDLKKEIL